MRVGLRVFEGKNLGVQSAAEILSANVGCCCACEVPKSEPASVKIDNKPIRCYGCFCDSYCVADGPMYILVSIKEKLHNQSQTGKIRINHEEGLSYFQQQINVWYISLSGIADIFRGWKILATPHALLTLMLWMMMKKQNIFLLHPQMKEHSLHLRPLPFN